MGVRVKTWHICISGFLQRSGRLTGMMKLWRKLGFLCSPDTQVIITPWRMDTWALAETIYMSNESYDDVRNEQGELYGATAPPKVYIYSYSWGAGWTTVNLVKELRNRGVPIVHVVMADPVYRSRWMPDQIPFNPSTWFNGAYFEPWPVYMHDNVLEVSWFYQDTNKPRAHAVKPWFGKKQLEPTLDKEGKILKPPDTIIHEGVLLRGVTHQYMDDDYRFHQECLKVAKESIK